MSEEKAVRYEFGADIQELFSIVTKAVYKESEVFLRELISNASDACEKLRYQHLQGDSNLESMPEFHINIKILKDQNKLVISDNGIGMDKDELMKNLGTIARSGTKVFFNDKISKKTEAVSTETTEVEGAENSDTSSVDQGTSGAPKDTSNFIGQFGIGFYSAFLVADSVEVRSRKVGNSQGYLWKSQGVQGFEIAEEELDFEHGTQITLHLKENASQYLEDHMVSHLVDLYSRNIMFSIYLEHTTEDGEVKKDLLNKDKALWMKPKNEITPEQHKEFFKTVSRIYHGDPYLTLHGHTEGKDEFRYLLYVPAGKPYIAFDPERKTRLKLYVKRIFVTEDGTVAKLIPAWMRFLFGVVDSDDLKLSISRETIQNSLEEGSDLRINRMREFLTRKVLSELEKAMNNDIEKYKDQFWKNWGEVLKEGLCEALNGDFRERVLDLCLFYTSKSTDKPIKLKEYVGRMQAEQKEIFYFMGDDVNQMMKHRQLEGFLKRDIEVLLLNDSVDSFWTSVVTEYTDKKLLSITLSSIDLDKIAESTESASDNTEVVSEESTEKLVKFIKSVLGDNIGDAVVSKKLTKSPACLSTREGQLNSKLEKYYLEHKQLHSRFRKNFEVNIKHPLLKKISSLLESEGETSSLKQMVWSLFDIICVIEEEPLVDTAAFSERSSRMLESLITGQITSPPFEDSPVTQKFDESDIEDGLLEDHEEGNMGGNLGGDFEATNTSDSLSGDFEEKNIEDSLPEELEENTN